MFLKRVFLRLGFFGVCELLGLCWSHVFVFKASLGKIVMIFSG